jgi:hypothetical protein
MNELFNAEMLAVPGAGDATIDPTTKVDRLTEEIRWFVQSLFDEKDEIRLRWSLEVWLAAGGWCGRWYEIDATYSAIQENWARWAAAQEVGERSDEAIRVRASGFAVARRPRKWADEADDDDDDPMRRAHTLLAPRFVWCRVEGCILSDLTRKIERASYPAPTTLVYHEAYSNECPEVTRVWCAYWRVKEELSVDAANALERRIADRLKGFPGGRWTLWPGKDQVEFVCENGSLPACSVLASTSEVKQHSIEQLGVDSMDDLLTEGQEIRLAAHRLRPAVGD